MSNVVRFQPKPVTFGADLETAIRGQALTISHPHRKFGQCYAEFIGHAADGKVRVRKLISSMFKARWTKPVVIDRAMVTAVHANYANRQVAA